MNIKLGKRLLIVLMSIFFLFISIMLVWIAKISKTTIVPIGETIVLNSKEEENAEKKWLPANCLMYDGTMELTVLKSEIYTTPEEAGIEDIYLSTDNKKNTSFLLVTYEVKNVNAISAFAEGFLSTELRLLPYCEVNSRVGMLKDIKGFNPEIVYSSVFRENVEADENLLKQPKEAFYYRLEKGESKEIQIGFYVDKNDYYENKIVLRLPTGHAGRPKTVLRLK